MLKPDDDPFGNTSFTDNDDTPRCKGKQRSAFIERQIDTSMLSTETACGTLAAIIPGCRGAWRCDSWTTESRRPYRFDAA
jgi:hypothetical protein